MISNFNQAERYLEKFISPIPFRKIENPAFDPLNRMRTLLKLLGNPHKNFNSIIVSGTSGKGSTSYILANILKNAGYKTGLTISPHIQSIKERIQINGREISDEKFTEMVNSLVQTIELMRKLPVGNKPSYFEILIGLAFLYFSMQKVDIAVVEVGIEGKYDATNVLNPLAVILTNISLDHTQILGETVEEIAEEATHIIRNLGRKPFVATGVKQKSVIDIVEKRCEEQSAKLLIMGKDFRYKIKQDALDGLVFNFYSSNKIFKNLKLSLIGDYQAGNASLAIQAALELEKFGFKISEGNIRQALKTILVPGRFEIFRRNETTLVLDGAHNPAKMSAFVGELEKLFPDKSKTFIIAFKKDKNIEGMLSSIEKSADKIILTEFSRSIDIGYRMSADIRKLKVKSEKLKVNKSLFMEDNIEKAIRKAKEITNKDDLIIVTGSLYLVGEARSLLLSGSDYKRLGN